MVTDLYNFALQLSLDVFENDLHGMIYDSVVVDWCDSLRIDLEIQHFMILANQDAYWSTYIYALNKW